MSKRKRSSQAGSALIELIISVLVVGLVLTTLAMTLTYSIKVTTASRQRDIATSLGQDIIEKFHKERAVRGWNEFYTFFEQTVPTEGEAGKVGFCVPEQHGNYAGQPLEYIFRTDSNAGTLNPDCRVTPSGTSIPLYTEVDVVRSNDAILGESVYVEVDVYWEYEGGITTETPHLNQPLVKVFRRIN